MLRIEPRQALLAFFYWLLVLYLFAPLLVMVAMSFKNGNFIGFPINSWTLKWYEQLLEDRDLSRAAAYSAMLAVTATAIALPVGTWCAVALSSISGTGRVILFAAACLPAIVPEIVNAISFRILIRIMHVPTGFAATVLVIAARNMPFIMLMVMTRLASMPRSQIEAAKDLGCNDLTAFMRVTLPFLKPALIGGAMFSMLAAFDDFVRVFFMSGYAQTLTTLIYTRLTTGFSPAITAVSTVVMLVTLAIGLLAERQIRRSGPR